MPKTAIFLVLFVREQAISLHCEQVLTVIPLLQIALNYVNMSLDLLQWLISFTVTFTEWNKP